MSAAAIELAGLVRRYEGHVAVDGVDLTVERGEFFTLLGPSGCGKSTTLRLIAGLERPDAGVIRQDGVDVTGVPPERRDVSTVFQDYALFPHMTVHENVSFPLRMRRVPREAMKLRVGEVLERVGLAGLDRRRPQELSGGQRQRVALARSLVWRPGALLLDEPLAALDRNLRASMQSFLKDLQRDVGITFVYVTHDQGEAMGLSDRIAVIRDGRISQVGSPVDIYRRPTSPFVATFVGSMNMIAGQLRDVGEIATVDVQGRLVRGSVTPGLEGLPVGSEVFVAVRPERVQLDVTEGTAGMVTVTARVLRMEHQGPMIEVVLATDVGQIRAASLDRDGHPIVGQDASLLVGWAVDDAQVFPAPEGAHSPPGSPSATHGPDLREGVTPVPRPEPMS